MNLNEYQALASRTRNRKQDTRDERVNYALGLAGEAGELANVVKKHKFHGHDLSEVSDKVLDEAGDVLWYLSQLLRVYDVPMVDVSIFGDGEARVATMDDYQAGVSVGRPVCAFALSVVEKAGRVAQLVNEQAHKGRSGDDVAPWIPDAAGDVLRQLTCLLICYDLKLSGAAQRNIDKLRKRYPEGFSEEASINRIV